MRKTLALLSFAFAVAAVPAIANAQPKPAAPAAPAPSTAKPAAPAATPAKPTAPPPPKTAAEKKKDADAKAAFRKAVALYDKKDYATAMPLFVQVHQQLQSPNAQLYIARCLRELKHPTDAWESFTAVAREANLQLAKDPSYEETRDAAIAEAAAIEPSIARVTFVLDSPPEGTVVTVNNEPVPTDRLGGVQAYMPGKVNVKATAPDRQDYKNELTLREGASIQVTIKLLREGEIEPGVKVPVAVVAPQQTSGDIRTLGFVVAGVGVIGAAMFVITHILADSEFDDLKAQCATQTPQCTNGNFDNHKSNGQTLDTLSNVGLAIGVVGLAAGGLMIAFGGKHNIEPTPKPADTPKAALSVGPGSVLLRGTF